MPRVHVSLALLVVVGLCTLPLAWSVTTTITSPAAPTTLITEPANNRRGAGDPYQPGVRFAGETPPMYPDPAYVAYAPTQNVYCNGVTTAPVGSVQSFCVPETPSQILVDGTLFSMRGAAYPPINTQWRTISETTGFANPGPSAPFYYDIQDPGPDPVALGSLRYNDPHLPPLPNTPLGYRDILQTLADQGSNVVRINVDYTAWPEPVFTTFLNYADGLGLKVIPVMYWDPDTNFLNNAQRCTLRTRYRAMVNALEAHPAVVAYGAMAFERSPSNWTHPTASFPELQTFMREMAWEAYTQDSGTNPKPTFITMSGGYEWIIQIRFEAGSGQYFADEYTMRIFDASTQGQFWRYNLNGLLMEIKSQPPRLKIWDIPRMSHVQAMTNAPAGTMLTCP